MPPVVIDYQNAEDTRDVVHLAVQALAEGKLVAFPTETVYGLACHALNEAAVERLRQVKGRPENQPLALAIRGMDEARDYVPDMSPLAHRLARRCWPGPVTMVLDASHPESLVTQLPDAVRKVVAPDDWVGLRVPAHDSIHETLRLLAGPLALTSANLSGEPDAVTAQAILDGLGDKLDLVIDDGTCRYGQPSTVLRVRGGELEILRQGVVPEQTLKRLSSFMIGFICTGNTCRSPMAEALARNLVAARLGCKIEELGDRGVIVESAGIAAMMGGRPAAEAVKVMGDLGLDLADHQSQPVTEQFIRNADVVFAMTNAHRDALLAAFPEANGRVLVLRHDRADISDPIGGTAEQYRQCAEQIRGELEIWIKELEFT